MQHYITPHPIVSPPLPTPNYTTPHHITPDHTTPDHAAAHHDMTIPHNTYQNVTEYEPPYLIIIMSVGPIYYIIVIIIVIYISIYPHIPIIVIHIT